MRGETTITGSPATIPAAQGNSFLGFTGGVLVAGTCVAAGAPLIGLALVLFGGVLAAAILSPRFGILAIAAMVPLEAYAWSEPGVRLRAYQAVVAAALLGTLWRAAKSRKRLTFPLLAPLATMLAINLFGLAHAESIPDSIVVLGLMITAGTLYFVGVNALSNQQTRNATWRVIVGAAVAVALLGLYQTVAIRTGWPTLLAAEHLYEGSGYAASFLRDEGRPSGTFTEPDLFGAYLAYALLLAAPAWLSGQGRARGWARIGAMVLVAALIVSMVRAAWVGLAVGLIVYFFLSWRGRLQVLRPLGALLLAGLVGIGVVSWVHPAALTRVPARVASIVDPNEENAQTRVRTLHLLGERIADRPLLGHGAGNIRAIDKSEENYLLGRVSWNFILTTLYDTGALGLAALLWLGIALAVWVRRGWLATASEPDRRTLLCACIAAGVALLVSSLFTNVFWRGFVWLHVALTVAVAAAAQPKHG